MNWSMITCAPLAKSPNCPSQIVRQRGSVVAKPRSLPVVAKHNVISWRTLTFMIVAVVCSLRAAPTMAVYGLASIFLYAVIASGTPQESES